jgi:hypothetical protein
MRLLGDKREERIYAARIISKLYCSKYDKGKSAFYHPSDGGVKNKNVIFFLGGKAKRFCSVVINHAHIMLLCLLCTFT